MSFHLLTENVVMTPCMCCIILRRVYDVLLLTTDPGCQVACRALRRIRLHHRGGRTRPTRYVLHKITVHRLGHSLLV